MSFATMYYPSSQGTSYFSLSPGILTYSTNWCLNVHSSGNLIFYPIWHYSGGWTEFHIIWRQDRHVKPEKVMEDETDSEWVQTETADAEHLLHETCGRKATGEIGRCLRELGKKTGNIWREQENETVKEQKECVDFWSDFLVFYLSFLSGHVLSTFTLGYKCIECLYFWDVRYTHIFDTYIIVGWLMVELIIFL